MRMAISLRLATRMLQMVFMVVVGEKVELGLLAQALGGEHTQDTQILGRDQDPAGGLAQALQHAFGCKACRPVLHLRIF